MQFTKFIGIDVSKDTLDFTVVQDGKVIEYAKTGNCPKEIRKLLSKFTRRGNATKEVLFCLEHTGVYTGYLIEQLWEMDASIWMESPLQIKRSMGLVRGKNDKVDSCRIAMYAFTHKHKARLWLKPRKEIKLLGQLIAVRRRLIKALGQLTVPLKEQKDYLSDKDSRCLDLSCAKTMAALKNDISKTEKMIKSMLNNDDLLREKAVLIMSVEGVGLITAAHVLVTTNEFKNIKDPKKYAAYSGVAPFENVSGTSIRGKSRVSHMANKKIKTVLHMAAMAALRTKGEMKSYYERKLLEGKNKFAIINAIRNKIIHRIFACVNQNRLYEKNYQNNLVVS